MTLAKVGSGNIWVATVVGKMASNATVMGAGSKTLSAALDRVRITRDGSNSFDSGSVNIQYI
jgi:hypothetical protein